MWIIAINREVIILKSKNDQPFLMKNCSFLNSKSARNAVGDMIIEKECTMNTIIVNNLLTMIQ